MKKIIYNKLVRDKIPEIIEKENKSCNTRILDNKSMLIELNKKLQEEVNEYVESGDIEELADIVEVVEGIIRAKGLSINELNQIKNKKRASRGGFEKNIFLIDVME